MLNTVYLYEHWKRGERGWSLTRKADGLVIDIDCEGERPVARLTAHIGSTHVEIPRPAPVV